MPQEQYYFGKKNGHRNTQKSILSGRFGEFVRESGRSVLYPGEFAYYALTLFLLLDSPEPLFRRIFFGLGEFRKKRYQVLHFTFSELDALLQTVSLLFAVVVKTAASISFICCSVL